MEIHPEAFVEPKEVKSENLTEEEVDFYSERAGEINYLLDKALSSGCGDPRELAEFSIYFFHLGREYEKGLE